jgi:hypothetical protein
MSSDIMSEAPIAALRDAAITREPDRYFAATLAPRAIRADLITLAAFAAELANIPAQVREPLAGEIRLQWWRDALGNRGGEVAPGHPVAVAMRATIARHTLPGEVVDAVIGSYADAVHGERPVSEPGGGGGRGGGDRSDRKRVPRAIRIGVSVEPEQVADRSSQFRVLEADAGLETLTDRIVAPWVDRTPEGFSIDVRAHRLLTHHPVPIESIGPDVRDLLPPTVRSQRQVYADDLPARALERALERFLTAVQPVHDFGKLGALVFAFPSYFVPGAKARDHLLWLREHCPLFREDAHTLNTPLRFLVPKPESGDCDDALLGSASPLRGTR